MMKILSRTLLFLYFFILIWVLFFKLRFNISSTLDEHRRSLNFVPFAAPTIINGEVSYGEAVWNFLFFIPFGMLLSVNFKRIRFLPKLLLMVAFSFVVEMIQYVFAIGATDITDLITNTAGGLLGLILYNLLNRFIEDKILDKIIVYSGIVLLALFFIMRMRITLR
ncbi:VanZ family protein [Pollutibacter soli]|uniref:VanZ family protein n=1 Tax=Pollutibacter soli TaxID=3034157 RepID=UPI0030133BDB